MTPRHLYELELKDPAVHFHYCTQEEYNTEKCHLKDRFAHCRPIVGTHSLHSTVPMSRTQLAVHSYSTSLSMSKVQVLVLKDDICFDDITGFVTCRYGSQWWLGCVLDTSADTEEVTTSFLHQCSPAPSFVYPRNPDVLVTHCTSVLTKVDPTTATGQFGAAEQVTAPQKLAQFIYDQLYCCTHNVVKPANIIMD